MCISNQWQHPRHEKFSRQPYRTVSSVGPSSGVFAWQTAFIYNGAARQSPTGMQEFSQEHSMVGVLHIPCPCPDACVCSGMQATRASSVRRTETATRGLEWTMTKRPQLVMSESASTPGQRTLAIDVGGTGLKASVLDARGQMLADPVRVATPYPCPPRVLVEALVNLVKPL